MQILQKIINIASSEKEEAIYTISCFDMHQRNRNTTADLEAYSFSISNSELVINELETYQECIDKFKISLEQSFLGKFEYLDYEDVIQTNVYQYLLEYYFSKYQTYIPNQPTDRIQDLIEYHYQKKKVYSEGFSKFFNIQKKKLVQDEEGNNVLVDWTDKDEVNKVSSEDLTKIELLQEWDSFVETMNKVKEMLENKKDALEILKLIK